MSKKMSLTIDRVNATIELDIDSLKEVRGNDNRGYATYNLQSDGKDIAIAGAMGENGEPSECTVQLLVVDSNKKSKGKSKSGKTLI